MTKLNKLTHLLLYKIRNNLNRASWSLRRVNSFCFPNHSCFQGNCFWRVLFRLLFRLPCYKFQIFRKYLKSTNLGDFWHYLQRRYNFFLEHLDPKWRGQYIYIYRNYIFLSVLFSKEGTLKILGKSHFSIQNSGETSQENKKT